MQCGLSFCRPLPRRPCDPCPPPLPCCRAQEAEHTLRQQLAALQARTAGLQAATCAAQAENLQLRQALHVAKQAAEPSVVQLRQLLLDPAVNREFAGLRAELEARAAELAAAQLELQAVRFGGPDPLLAKVAKLQVGRGGGWAEQRQAAACMHRNLPPALPCCCPWPRLPPPPTNTG